MKPVLAIDTKATEHITHRQGIGRLKHINVAHLWMQDEIRSRGCVYAGSRVKKMLQTWETKPLSRAVIAKHCLMLGYAIMAEENVECERQVVAMFWDFGSTVSLQQQSAGDHAQTAASSNRRNQ